ncbi:DUF2946 family protein [Tibeticola sediminis]|uniref:DUF2946 family protein n=1 Tax=Tibeticola sediminis TaxID=1917811 RepID=A0A3N4U7T1_9BURK|nr:DUF2946 family protein [Tibeticola sediminis]RPE63009.1 DUF2946 family protein [Tibeticola sediminis]
MDDIVIKAMAKWPNVPDCYGWLGLDARGHWWMRDARTQALGPFPTLDTPGPAAARGARLAHEKLIEFIGRNYQADAAGRWFFQNGPQRVYVSLEATPWIWRLQSDATQADAVAVQAHTGVDAGAVRSAWLDEAGRLYLHTDLGFGLVDSADMWRAAAAVEAGRWTPQPIESALTPQRFGFVRAPTA